MDHGHLLRDGAEIAAVVVVALIAVWLGAWRYERHIAKHGRPGGAPMGDAFGSMIDVFDPGQARANRDLKEQQNVGPVSRVPERDPDDPIQLNLGLDGTPKSVRIRRDRPARP